MLGPTTRPEGGKEGRTLSYDPVAPSTVQPAQVRRDVDDALAAIAKASDLDELKAARLAHAGDRSPLALANREIGQLPPAARAAAGKRVGEARAAVAAALKPSATPGSWSTRRSTSPCRGTAASKARATR